MSYQRVGNGLNVNGKLKCIEFTLIVVWCSFTVVAQISNASWIELAYLPWIFLPDVHFQMQMQ